MSNKNLNTRLLKLFAKRADGPPSLLQRPIAPPVQLPIPFPNFESTGGMMGNPWNTPEFESYARGLGVNPEQAYQQLQSVAQSTGTPFDQVFKQYSDAARQRQQEIFTRQQSEANRLKAQQVFAQSQAATKALTENIHGTRKTMPQDRFGNPTQTYTQQQAAGADNARIDEELARKAQNAQHMTDISIGQARSIDNPTPEMRDTVNSASKQEAETESANNRSNALLKAKMRDEARAKLEAGAKATSEAGASALAEAEKQLAAAQEAQDAAAKDKAPVDRKLLDILMRPTDDAMTNYGIHGGLGALLGGGLGTLFSSKENRLRNALLFALLGGGLGLGGSYLANQANAAPTPAAPTT